METDTTIQVALAPLLIGAAAVGQLLGVSVRTVWTMNETGELGPLPLHLRGRTLWKAEEIRGWVSLNCPSRERWDDMQKVTKNLR